MSLEGEAQTQEDPGQPHWQRREIGLALRNALKLGGSLIATWGIGIAAGLFIPRFLGPARYGVLTFSDAFTSTAFVLLNLGLDTYVRKEVSVRPKHASDFVGGVVLLRAVLTLFVFGGMELFLRLTHRTDEVRLLVYIYGIGQFFANGNNTSAGLLHAKGNVNELSVFSVIMKVLWGLAIFAALFFKLNLWAFALAFLVSEALKSGVLYRLTVKHLDLEMRIDMKAVRTVIIVALPLYLSNIATMVYGTFDMSILAVVSSDSEVGWYGGAKKLATLASMLMPLITWVMVPLFARAAAVSHDELTALARRSAELILTGVIPLALMMAAGSDVWIRIAVGAKFAPAAPALEILSAVFVLMYVSIVCWCTLVMLNRTWALTAIFTVGMVVNPLFNLLLIRPVLAHHGAGGGGIACALASVLTEICVLTPMLYILGRRIIDARLMRMVVKSFGAAILIFVIDRLLKPWIGFYRLPLDLLGYVSLILVTRAVDVRETIEWTREILRRRKEGSDSSPANSG